jgi:hypothetical protein
MAASQASKFALPSIKSSTLFPVIRGAPAALLSACAASRRIDSLDW